jgi:hypothetical protein
VTAAEFTVGHDYSSVRDGETYAWKKGDRVEVDTELADWVNRDSPGTLAAAAKGKK